MKNNRLEKVATEQNHHLDRKMIRAKRPKRKMLKRQRPQTEPMTAEIPPILIGLEIHANHGDFREAKGKKAKEKEKAKILGTEKVDGILDSKTIGMDPKIGRILGRVVGTLITDLGMTEKMPCILCSCPRRQW